MQKSIATEVAEFFMADPLDRREIRRVKKAAATELGSLVEQAIGSEADVYVIGLNHDFDDFARRYAVSLGERLVGVACLSSEIMRYPTDTGERLFSSGRMTFAENAVRLPTAAVVFVSVASDELEIVNAISTVFAKIGSTKVIVAAALSSQGICERMPAWLEEFSLPTAEVVSLQTYDGDLRPVRDRIYTDDREVQIVAKMPIWIMERAFGPPPEHLREKYALKD